MRGPALFFYKSNIWLVFDGPEKKRSTYMLDVSLLQTGGGAEQ